MTPFELKIRNELDVEWQRFANKWLFPWHQMKMEGQSFTVEDFRGGIISYGGIKFGDQQQQVFWFAIEHYLKQKSHEVFQRWDVETKEYPAALRSSSLNGTTNFVRNFHGCILKQAVDTDQRLRGDGNPPKDVTAYAEFAGVIAGTEIQKLSDAYRALLPLPTVERVEPEKAEGLKDKVLDAINLRPGMFGFSVDLKKLFQKKQ
jgi:hypothetical protein